MFFAVELIFKSAQTDAEWLTNSEKKLQEKSWFSADKLNEGTNGRKKTPCIS